LTAVTVPVTGGLDRLDHGAGVAGFDAVADVGQFDVDQIAKQALGVIGDADGDFAVAFDAGPLVGLQELQIAGNFTHGWPRTLRGAAGNGA
jgi:hypothetical protein